MFWQVVEEISAFMEKASTDPAGGLNFDKFLFRHIFLFKMHIKMVHKIYSNNNNDNDGSAVAQW